MPSLLPLVTVEVGFGQSIATGHDSIDWTDVTGWIRAESGVRFNRGRAEAGSGPTAGTCEFTLANGDGRFTPGRGGGPHGAIKTGFPVRVTAKAASLSPSPYAAAYAPAYRPTGGAVVNLWWGFITDWSWDAAGEIRATVNASDIIAAAGRTKTSAWLQARHRNPPTGVDPPTGYWPLADEPTAAAAASGLDNGVPAVIAVAGNGGTLSLGVESDLGPDPDIPVAAFAQSGAHRTFLRGSWAKASSLGDLAVSGWVLPMADKTMTWLSVWDGTDGVMSVGVDDSQRVVVVEDGQATTYGGTNTVPVGWWSHVYVQRDQSETVRAARTRVWVAGVERGAATPVAATWSSVTLDGSEPLRVDIGATWEGQLAHAAVWGHDVPTDAFASWLRNRGQYTPTAGTRFADLASVTGSAATWSTWLEPSTADARITAQPTAGATLLDLAQQIADTEAGRLIATRRGRFALQRSSVSVTDTPAVTFDARRQVLALDGAFTLTDVDVVDEVVVTNQPSGAQITRRRWGASGTGVESAAREVWAADTVHAEAIADQAVRERTEPSAPLLRVSMDRAAFDDSADPILTLELGDLVRVVNLPGAAPATSMDLIVESIDHDISASGWTVTIGTSPGDKATGWVLGHPTLSKLGSTTILRL